MAVAALACAAPPPGSAWRAAHPDRPRVAPAADAELGAVLASLGQDEPDVTPTELRMLDLSGDPWRELDDEAGFLAGAVGDALQALLVERECRQPGLTGARLRRASWLLFRGGRLLAWDHTEFAPECVPEHRFQPAPEELRGFEEDLERSRARRFPASAADPETTFRKGLAYLEHDRPAAAAAALARGERALATASRRAAAPGAPPGAVAALAPARALRGQLRRALRRHQGLDEDPSERFWKGE